MRLSHSRRGAARIADMDRGTHIVKRAASFLQDRDRIESGQLCAMSISGIGER
jgi:hypothetical protein